MTDHLEVATRLAEIVQTDCKRLSDEYAKPVAPAVVRANGFTSPPRPAAPAPEGGYRDNERVNRLNGRTGRTIKRAEVHGLLAIAQRLDDIHQLLDERLAELNDALLVEGES